MSLTNLINHPNVCDKGLEWVEANVTRVVACSQKPTTYTEANATYKLGEVTVDSDDMTITNGDSTGQQPRKITMAQVTGSVTADGEATYVAWLDVANSLLVFAQPCTAQVLTTGNPLTFSSHAREILAGTPD